MRLQPAAEIELSSSRWVGPVNPPSIRKDVCQCAFCSELAVALPDKSVRGFEKLDLDLQYLGKIFTRRIDRCDIGRVGEGARFPRLALS